MIVLQHFLATEKHVKQVEEVAKGRHEVIVAHDFHEIPNFFDTEILFTFGKGSLDSAIRQMPKLKWIQLCSTGFDHLPKEYILDRRIKVTTAKGAHAEPIAEYAVSCMLYFARKLDKFLELQKQKKWYRLEHPSEITGKTVVVLGTGYIGKEIAKKARAFNMITIGINRTGAHQEPFDQIKRIDQLVQVLPKADYLILSLPLTNLTDQIIGSEQLSLLKPSAVVINLGRGELMDEFAALEVLQTKRIRGMAMDVFQQEPLPEDSPLWEMEGLLITPHMAALTDRFLDRSLDRFIENYQLYINGKEMIDLADFSKGY